MKFSAADIVFPQGLAQSLGTLAVTMYTEPAQKGGTHECFRASV